MSNAQTFIVLEIKNDLYDPHMFFSDLTENEGIDRWGKKKTLSWEKI